MTDVSQLKIAGNCSQNAGNAILEKISRTPLEARACSLCHVHPNHFNPATALDYNIII